MAEDRPQDCVSRTLYATAAGAGFGAISGAVAANWSDVPKVIRNQSLPALKQTGALMGAQGAMLAAIGAAYAVADCAAESFRGKRDTWNGVWGGVAAGLVIGARSGRPAVAIGAGTALALASAVVDTASHRVKGSGLLDDNLTPGPVIYPYTSEPLSEE